MRLPYADVQSINRCRRLVKCWERDLIKRSDLFRPVFDALGGCTTDDGVRQCIAVLPEEILEGWQHEIDQLRIRAHAGEFLIYAPNCPTPQELELLDARALHLLNVVVDYLRNPTGPVEFEVDHEAHRMAVLLQSWHALRDCEIVNGEGCRREGCCGDRVRYSVFCREHHFEAIHGEPPPREGLT